MVFIVLYYKCSIFWAQPGASFFGPSVELSCLTSHAVVGHPSNGFREPSSRLKLAASLTDKDRQHDAGHDLHRGRLTWPHGTNKNCIAQKITKNQKCVELCGVLFIYTYDVHMHKHKHMYYIISSICLSIHPYIHLSIHLYVEFLRYASQLCRCQLERPLNTTTIWPMFDKSRQQLSLAPQAKRGRGTGYSPHLR